MLVALGLFAPGAVRAAPRASPWVEAIDESIERARTYLYATQRDGHWEAPAAAPGTRTAIATLGLLWANTNPQAPKMEAALATLRAAAADSTEARAARVEALTSAWSSVYRGRRHVAEVVRGDANAVLNSVVVEGGGPWVHAARTSAQRAAGGGGVVGHARAGAAAGRVGPADPGEALSVGASAAAVAMLAESQFEVPSNYWAGVDQAWRALQAEDGSFAALAEIESGPGRRPTRGDVARATAQALLVLAECARARAAAVDGDPAIERAIAHLGRSWDDLLTGDRAWEGAYAVARALHTARARFAGGADWAPRLVRFLVESQRANGSWGDGPQDTGYALMALRFCRAPIVVHKLRYRVPGDAHPDAHWNRRPRDVVEWVGHAARMYCGGDWLGCAVTLDGCDDGRLADVPILYIAGDAALAFTEAERARLRRYVEGGGTIVGNADGGGRAFADSFRTLGRTMYPDLAFGPPPADDPLTAWTRLRAASERFGVETLSGGVRARMILLSKDPAAHWDARHAGAKVNPPAAASFDLGDELIRRVLRNYLRSATRFAHAGEAPKRRTDD
ncbi:MAG TPA: DUF4159 domain-containing protein [Tepidisphaeraceae bacterium]|nr:DUF4159 domain-containing protein [Tepidisphaeraceae bacterium]